ncbi:nuclear transport factor 2 family protein [Micromonospora sp. NPDC050397]|uniref:nuclear transport factor 2 family protein n=1 Tax=Micromonospora sp. NPDC050397 TaxID=3364279 RepID=UPI00384E62E7
MKAVGPLGGRFVSDPDHLALTRLVTEAAWRVDLGKAGTLYELFTPEGELNLGSSTLSGHDAIRQWGEAYDADNPRQRIRHVCGNMRFVTDGDDRAVGATILTVFMDEGEGPGRTLPWTVGEDHDRFRRTDDGWRITSREWVTLFLRPGGG